MGITTDRSDPDLHSGEYGQAKKYLVLSKEEREKGFIRPLRQSYIHIGACDTKTTMGLALAETYSRDPSFYSATFCVGCNKHLPVSEFRWLDGEIVGS